MKIIAKDSGLSDIESGIRSLDSISWFHQIKSASRETHGYFGFDFLNHLSSWISISAGKWIGIQFTLFQSSQI